MTISQRETQGIRNISIMSFKVISHFLLRLSKFNVFILMNSQKNTKVLFLEIELLDFESHSLTILRQT